MPLVVNGDNVDSIVLKLSSEPVLAVDTETTGLDWTDRPFLAILASSSEEFLFPLPEFASPLFHILTSVKELVFQNAKFDIRMLHNAKVFEPNLDYKFHDIQVAARILKNNYFGKKEYSLAAQAKRYGMQKLDDEVKDYIKEHNLYEIRTSITGESIKHPRYDWVPEEIMYRYAAMDARLTYDLWDIYRQDMDDYDRKVYAMEMDCLHTCYAMEREGIHVNLEYTREARAEALQQLRQAEERFKATTGVDFKDSKSVLVPIFEAAGEKFAKTPSGQPRLTDADLERFTSPAAEVVRDIRSQAKFINTYYENYINMAPEGIIRPTMWQAGTRTGRFSYSDPNLQNIPKEEDSVSKYVVRGCFQPAPGSIFVAMDYAQQEYRLMLAYANQRDLIEAVMAGADVHQATADLVGISRSYAKTLNFAILYGAGPDKVAQMLRITKKEAEKLINKYYASLPKVKSLIKRVTDKARQRGFLYNWYGRRLRFGWVTYLDEDTQTWQKYHDAYTGPNHIMQGGGADIIKVSMGQGTRRGLFVPGCQPVLQVHDELVLAVKPHYYNRLVDIAAMMENAFPEKNGMRMKVDVSWSSRSLAKRDLIKGYPWETSNEKATSLLYTSANSTYGATASSTKPTPTTSQPNLKSTASTSQTGDRNG